MANCSLFFKPSGKWEIIILGFRFSLLILLRLRIKLFDSLYKYVEDLLQAKRQLALSKKQIV